MKNYVNRGMTFEGVAPYAVLSGGVVKIGSKIGVAVNDVANAASGVFYRFGHFDLVKANETWADGDKIYWDDTAKVVTKVSTSNTLVGVAEGAVASAGNLVGRVYLDGTVR